MKQYVRCRACGNIMEEGKVRDCCPACGLPKTVFEPYKLTISEKRKMILGFHIHPMIVHFPQALTILGLLMILVIPWIFEPVRTNLVVTHKVLMTLLPFTVVGALLSGMFDGKVRFKKLGTPMLKKKIVLGSAFFASSTAAAIFVYFDFTHTLPLAVEIVALFICSLCAVILGLIGSKLIDLKMPGK